MTKYFFTTTLDKNIAFHVNDDIKLVQENRLKLNTKYNINIKDLRYMNQVHGCNIQIVNKKSDSCIHECDALLTNEPDLPLMVMVADCIPILLYDESKGVIAAVHAGRNGTFLDIAKKTVLNMLDVFNCEVKNIKAVFGPSIQKCCYEVSLDMENVVKNKYGHNFTHNRFIDLQGINKKQLLDMGLLSTNIDISEVCTKCSQEPYYSYRIDNTCGRFAGIISSS